MYGGMVPRYTQRELAHLRQENQILRYRVASLAMSQPLGRPRSVRHQATQTAPAITFSTASGNLRHPSDAGPLGSRGRRHLPPASAGDGELDRGRGARRLPAALARGAAVAFVGAHAKLAGGFRSRLRQSRGGPDVQAEAIQERCSRSMPPCRADALAEEFRGIVWLLRERARAAKQWLDLVIHPHRIEQSVMGAAEASAGGAHALSPIDEDVDQLRQLPLDEVSPGHPSTVPSLSSGWQQQVSCRLAQERWVLSESIRVTATAAIPVISMITTPEDEPSASTDAPDADVAAVGNLPETEELLSFSICVYISLEAPNHLGLRSKAFLNCLLNEFPTARPVTLVLKQWLHERTFGMSYTGGLCSYGRRVADGRGVPPALPLELRRGGPRRLLGLLRAALRSQVVWGQRRQTHLYPPEDTKGMASGAGRVRGAGFLPGPRRVRVFAKEAVADRGGGAPLRPVVDRGPFEPDQQRRAQLLPHQADSALAGAAADALTSTSEVGPGAQLRAILRVVGHAARNPGDAELPEDETCGGGFRGPRWDENQRRQAAHARHALHEDLYQSLVEPNMMSPMLVRAQIARSHLPQQWDSAVRYAARPPCARSR
eukprot:CAMPEP_0117461064 /NCGR_PEP_ID=MMETSP0784-20121206/2331_1 /TAXON_ID=39447 /ORGANISM="" /LENGTH=601 /DNA_ID=CAMNT_0005254757 /DNA_START=30 /DNA_END=1834 /DNA_ORIENTATION=+